MNIKSLKQKKPNQKDQRKLSGYDVGSSIRQKVEKQFDATGHKLNSWQEIVGKKTTSAIVIFLWLTSFCYFLYSFLTVIIKH